jgi:hypothetical protein
MAEEMTHTRSCPELNPASEERCTCGLEDRKIIRDLCQAFEDLIAVATVDVDADGWITAYHFKTGALHRLLGKARALSADLYRPGVLEVDRSDGKARDYGCYARKSAPCVGNLGHGCRKCGRIITTVLLEAGDAVVS